MTNPRLRRRHVKAVASIASQAWLDSGRNEQEAIELAKERVGGVVEVILIKLAIELVVYLIKKQFFGPESESAARTLGIFDDRSDDDEDEYYG